MNLNLNTLDARGCHTSCHSCLCRESTEFDCSQFCLGTAEKRKRYDEEEEEEEEDEEEGDDEDDE